MTKEEAFKQAQAAANRANTIYIVSKRPSGDWTFGRRFWYEQHPDGISHHRLDTEKTEVKPAGMVGALARATAKTVKIHPPMNGPTWMGRI